MRFVSSTEPPVDNQFGTEKVSFPPYDNRFGSPQIVNLLLQENGAALTQENTAFLLWKG
jgi:hypothetical protein